MFETPHMKERGESPAAESIVVSSHVDGGVLIRQRGAKEDQGYVVIPPEQAEPLIAAIRRHLNPGK
jgi:hypothetical protein